MAILLPKENIIDNENDKFIGIKLPVERSNGMDGYFKSTEITLEAIKQNITNLLNTKTGERVFQPSIGSSLNNFLFENVDNEMVSIIDDQIRQTFSNWMPFITIRNMVIDTNNNKLNIELEFFMNNNPNILESVQIIVG